MEVYGILTDCAGLTQRPAAALVESVKPNVRVSDHQYRPAGKQDLTNLATRRLAANFARVHGYHNRGWLRGQ